MKITKRQLRRIIKEETAQLLEIGDPPDMNAPGWSPNDSQEWERAAGAEGRQSDAADKRQFLADQQARWEDHWGIDDDIEAEVIISILSEAYDKIEAEWGL